MLKLGLRGSGHPNPVSRFGGHELKIADMAEHAPHGGLWFTKGKVGLVCADTAVVVPSQPTVRNTLLVCAVRLILL